MKSFSNKTYIYIIVTVLIVACLITYGRILGNGFINYDDNLYITENSHVRSGLTVDTVKWAFTAVVSSNWHPLTFLSHAMDWSMFGDRAGGHHFVNLLLHIGGVLLLFLFLYKTTRSIWPAAFAAALFALHPLRVESVAWAAERKDVLSMFFGLGALYTYAFYVDIRHASQYILCLILFALALMAKPMLVTLPFVLLLLDYWPLERWKKETKPVTNESKVVPVKKKDKQQRSQSAKQNISVTAKEQPTISQLLWEKTPFFILAVISGIMTVWAQQKDGALVSFQGLSFSKRFMNAVVSYVLYLRKTFWPMDLAIFYPYQHVLPFWQFLGALLILLLISAVVILYIRKLPFLFVGWFWYLGTLVPVIGIVQVGSQSMADRYTYLPSIGIGIILAWGIMNLLPKERLQKIILIPLAVIVIILMTVLTWRQCGYWKNSITLFNHALNVTTDNYLAHNYVGLALAAQGKYREAESQYKSALEINPYYELAHFNLGIALASQGRNREAIDHYLAVIETKNDDDVTYTNLGIALAAEGKSEEAIVQYRRAIKINPDNDNAHYNLANLFARHKNNDEAILHYSEAVRINPSNFRAINNLGVNLEIRQKHEEAIKYYKMALQITPNDARIYFNLGVAYGNNNNISEAINNFRRAIDLNPEFKEAHLALKHALPLEKKSNAK